MSHNGKDFNEVVALIVRHDRRYDGAAYHFVRHALDHTLRSIKKEESEKGKRKSRHVSGPELLEGIRDFALEQFGPMTMTLFHEWGVRRSRDFGEIVFSLVDYGIFGKTPTDRVEDFEGVYDFHDAFERPFLPRNARPQARINNPSAS